MTENIKIRSINVGKPAQVIHNGKEVSTGINKTPVNGAIYLSLLNFEGDGQADHVHHGGEDKAVCVYPFEWYAYWEQEIGTALAFGAFGENLTTEGMVEDDICIGDIFELGEALVQVSQPRQPCFKLAVKYGVPDLPLKVQQTGYTGYYLRVLREGLVSSEDRLILSQRHPARVTLTFANQIMHKDKDNMDGVSRILEVTELSDSWRQTLAKRLNGGQTPTKERLTGDK
ncbi:MOSC domain-containing protein YiiM [Paenibacillus anaericanus]|uniref:MOSC domain-containing protein n=1 Tax=Paenibacillus anaericanus TaxID=170367 RepID=UPI00277FF179|nr:MOSC domain-containing protein [Paenibacillus anaericanus]MDQ0089437.1 MOSC domain-containing protein YiiM [Paenibacillus anaericanus]